MSGRRRRTAGLLTGALALAVGCGSGDPELPPRPVRVVLITLDTLRLDSFAGRGGVESLMPRTLERAGRGLVFESHFTASSTTMPTHVSMFTGLHPWEHGVTANGMVCPRELDTITERFRAAGFRTGAVVASYPLHGKFGLERGFDVYHNEFRPEGENVLGDVHARAPRINERAHQVLDELDGGDQFLWFHYFDAHSPYGDASNPTSNWFPSVLVRRIKDQPHETPRIMKMSREYYDADVVFLDREIQSLFERLDAESERWETHVVVVSDHGEAFGEGGAFGHGERLVEVQIRAPLFILSPRVAPGVRTEPVGSVDVGATLLALAGLPTDLSHGRDLTGPLDARAPVLGMRRTFEQPELEIRVDGTSHELDEHLFYVVEGGRMLVGNRGKVTRGDSDRRLRQAGKAEELMGLFAGFEDDLSQLTPQTLDDEETLAALKALGYIDDED